MLLSQPKQDDNDEDVNGDDDDQNNYDDDSDGVESGALSASAAPGVRLLLEPRRELQHFYDNDNQQ